MLSTLSTRVLVNGEPGQVIDHYRGLRQGDPLSPMFFILVMDVLNSIVARADHEMLLEPLAVPQTTHRVSLYADDVVMFLRPTTGDLSLIKQILEFFGQISRLKTNMVKSFCTPIHCLENDLELISKELSVK